MEINITFSNPSPSTTIPIDYQYFLGSWIYSVIAKGDENYAAFLHQSGYKVNNGFGKSFKLFCFSALNIPEYAINKENQTLTIMSESFSLKIRFKIDEALGNFVKGLFMGESLSLKSGFNTMVRFEIKTVESKNIIVQNPTTFIKACTPIVVAQKQELKQDLYLSPTDNDYNKLFFNNLLDKFVASGGTIPPYWDIDKFNLQQIGKYPAKSKLVKIYKQHQEPIKVRGFLFDFELTAPPELTNIGLLAGFGRDSSMGFGFGEVVDNK